jgi:hypothetical protein
VDKIIKYSVGVMTPLLLSSMMPNAVNASGAKAVAEQDSGPVKKAEAVLNSSEGKDDLKMQNPKEWRPNPEHVASSKKDQIEEYMNRHWQGETIGERLLPVAQLKYGDNVSVFNISGQNAWCGWRAICAGVKADQHEGGKLTLIDDVEVQQLLSDTANTVLELFYKYQMRGTVLESIFNKLQSSICSEVFDYPSMIIGYLFAEGRFGEVKEYTYVNILLNELKRQAQVKGKNIQNEYLVEAYTRDIKNGNVQLEKVLVPFVQKCLASQGKKCNIEITTFCLADEKVRFQNDSLQWFYPEDENTKPIRMIYLDYGKGNNGHYNIVLENCITEIENLLGEKGFPSLDGDHKCMCCTSRPNYQANGEKLSRPLTPEEKNELESTRAQIEKSIRDLDGRLVAEFSVDSEERAKLQKKLVAEQMLVNEQARLVQEMAIIRNNKLSAREEQKGHEVPTSIPNLTVNGLDKPSDGSQCHLLEIGDTSEWDMLIVFQKLMGNLNEREKNTLDLNAIDEQGVFAFTPEDGEIFWGKVYDAARRFEKVNYFRDIVRNRSKEEWIDVQPEKVYNDSFHAPLLNATFGWSPSILTYNDDLGIEIKSGKEKLALVWDLKYKEYTHVLLPKEIKKISFNAEKGNTFGDFDLGDFD